MTEVIARSSSGAWFLSFSGGILMALPDFVLAVPASSRYVINVIGGDAIFLVDRSIGQKVHLGADRLLSRPEFRRYVSALQYDLENSTVGEFFSKYGITG